jgi:hypothetical protein
VIKKKRHGLHGFHRYPLFFIREIRGVFNLRQPRRCVRRRASPVAEKLRPEPMR